MEPALLVMARLLLAVVVAAAGLAKLVDRAGSREAIVNFGLPAGLAAPVGVALPVIELILAGALLMQPTARLGAVGTLLFLLVFMVVIAANPARGRRPDCHRFGQIHAAQIGLPALGRNAVLVALAGFVVWHGPGGSLVDGLGRIPEVGRDLGAGGLKVLVSPVLLSAVAAVEGWVLFDLMRKCGRLLIRLEALEARAGNLVTSGGNGADPLSTGMEVGLPAAAFELRQLRGGRMTSDSLRALGRPVMLIFWGPRCGPCAPLLPQIPQWQREEAGHVTVAVLTRRSARESRAAISPHLIEDVLLQEGGGVDRAYGAVGTPRAVLLTPEGMIGSPMAVGAEVIGTLFAQVVVVSRGQGAHGSGNARARSTVT